MSSMYQKFIKKLLNKDVADAYPTEAPVLDSKKKLSEQLSLNEAALNMGSSAGTVAGSGAKKGLSNAEKFLDHLRLSKKPAEQVEKQLLIKESRDPGLDLKKELAMDVLGAKNVPKENIISTRGERPASRQSRKELFKVFERAKEDVNVAEKLQKGLSELVQKRKSKGK